MSIPANDLQIAFEHSERCWKGLSSRTKWEDVKVLETVRGRIGQTNFVDRLN